MKIYHAAFSVSLVLALSLSTGCGGGGSDSDDTADVSGAIAFVAASPLTIGEAEPNDSIDQPQKLEDIAGRIDLNIRGTVGEGDEIDAFAFVARERMTISAALTFDSAPGRTVQLGVFDPLALELVTRAGIAGAQFDARGAFDLVVRADLGQGPYTLVVSATPAPATIARAGWLGSLSVGDAVTLAGGDSTTWTATCAESVDLVIDGVASGVVRVKHMNGTAEWTAGTSGARLQLSTLEQVEIQAERAGEFSVRIEEPTSDASVRTTARVQALERERDAWNVLPTARLYGEPVLEAAPGDVLVRALSGRTVTADYARRGSSVKDVLPGIADLVHIELSPSLNVEEQARSTAALVRSFSVSTNVEYAELNLIRRAQGGPITPNDTHYGLQWHYPLIKLPQAWGVFTGTTNTIVAVIDTGSRPHVDLNANLIAGYDFISSPTAAGDGDGRDADPFDVGDGSGPTPSSFHGTHVAGTIAAATNNGSGVAGVCGPANRTRVMHLRALGIGGGTDADIAQAILYAARLTNGSGQLPAQRADIINMSLGGPGSTASVQSAINSAVAAGVTLFGASGNNNSGTAFFPASYNNVISVSAVDINSAKAPYSNFNATVDICAPGGDTSVDLNNDTYADGVLSTLVNQQTGAPIFAFYQGTSMACPHAAGVAALMKSQNPALTPAQIEAMLKSASVDLGAVGHDPIYGQGLVDAYQALIAAGAGSVPGSPALSVSPSSLAFGSQETQLTFQIVNLGGGMLDVGGISDDAPWLTLVEVAATGGTTDVAAVRCTVDRTALGAGNFTATVTVNANNGTVPSQTVAITMSVVPAPVLVDVDLYLLAVEADTFTTVQQIVLNPTTGLNYQFVDLPAGDYIFVCGSDEDLTDGICGPNDIYCGIYPTVNQPEILRFGGGNYSGLNFVVGPADSGPASTVPTRTYRRLW
ncbi:MAG: S8 family peptidase [Planctomycetes bacterium]|nr:S8 family peptidase [Planctomycetota bacterium]